MGMLERQGIFLRKNALGDFYEKAKKLAAEWDRPLESVELKGYYHYVRSLRDYGSCNPFWTHYFEARVSSKD